MEIDILKNRSLPACIKSASKEFFENIWYFIKKTRFAIICYVLIASVCLLEFVPDRDIHLWGVQNFVLTLTVTVIIHLLSLAALAWLIHSTTAIIHDDKHKKGDYRALAIVALWALPSIIVYVCSILGLNIWVISAIVLIFFVAYIPTIHSSLHYLLNTTSSFNDMFSGAWRRGWRRWGRLFLALLSSLLMVLPIILLGALPLIVMIMAQVSNQLGMLAGDYTGMPAYYILLIYLAAIVFFIFIAVCFEWLLVVMSHVYGSIESYEKEKELSENHIDKAE